MEKSDTDSSTKKRRSHHKKCKCPSCSKEVFDLKRHLRMHVKNEDIDEVDVDKSFSIAVNTTKRRGPRRPGNRKGLPLKWCPVEDCSYVTAHLRKHLMNNHRVKAGAYFDNLLKEARLYKGKEEVDNLPLVKQEPETRSLQQQQPVDKEPEVSVEEVKEDQEEPSSYLEDEDYEEDQLQEQYFTSANPKTTRHKWLVLFYQWLNTADAGRKKDCNRLQHASHIRLMLEDLQPGGDGIDVLSADEGQIVWTDWVDVKLLLLKSGTINGYLGTYEKFLQFVVEDRVRVTEYPPVDPEVRRIFMNTIPKLKGWRRTVDLEGRAETNQRRMDECTYRLTTDDVKAFLSSPICVNARKIFDKANDKYMLTVNKMCEARDYLITMISLKTGTRPGALENLKLQEYSQAKADPNTSHKVLLVPQHKRQSDGPAPLAIDKELEGLFNIFLCEIYHQFPAPRGPTIFLRNDGTSFQFGTISKRLPEFWRKSNIRPDIRVTATNIRKWIVTACNMKKKEGYLREDLTTVAASAMDIISSCTLAVENPTTTAKTTDNSEQSVMSEKGEAHDPNTDSCEVVSPPSAEERTSQEPPVNSQQPMMSDKGDTRDPNINSCGVVSPPSAEKGTSQEPPVNSQQSMMSDKGETHDPNTDSSEVVSPPSAKEGTEKSTTREEIVS